MRINHCMAAVIGAAVSFSTVATAAEFRPSSVRALAMGGSNVASTNGVDATYWNPAAYGFFGEGGGASDVDNNGLGEKDFGIDLGGTAGLSMFGSIAENLNKAQAMSVPTGNQTTGLNGAQTIEAANFSKGLQSLNSAPGGMNVTADTVAGARIYNYGLGLRVAVDVNAGLEFDNQNVGLGANYFTSLTGAAPGTVLVDPTLAVPGSTLYFNAAQQNQIATGLTNSGMNAASATQMAANYNYYLSVQNDPLLAAAAGVPQDLTLANNQTAMASAVVDLYSAPGNAQNNQSSLRVRGVWINEVGFTYGHAFSDAFSAGVVFKYMLANMVDETDANVFSSSNTTSKVQNATWSEDVSGYGIDLGMMYRLQYWQLGVTAKNINAPAFENSLGYVYEMKPQVKAGVAWIPHKEFSVELGMDLTENEGAVSDSKSKYWNAGVELNAWEFLALRAGVYQNLADDSIGLVRTAGLGINLWAMRLDVGAALSSKNVIVEGEELPAYAVVSAALAIDF